jgi:hypothetical protein
VAKKVDDHYEIVPTRVLTRPTGDIHWQEGQEHGPISPRQFIKAGESLTLENPEVPQSLQFIIHVLPAFDPQSAAISAKAGAAPEQTTATDLFTAGNNSTNQVGGVVSAGNVLLMPASTRVIDASSSTSPPTQHCNNSVRIHPSTSAQRETKRKNGVARTSTFELQPEIIVNNRNGLTADFSTPERSDLFI